MALRFAIGVRSTRGVGPERGGRRANEDNFLVAARVSARFLRRGREVRLPAEGSGILVAVADGMGGHEHGALASEAAVRALVDLYREPPPAYPEVALLNHVLREHRRLRAEFHAAGHANSGTTLTAGWLLDDRIAWVHVGDSRLYLLRAGELHRLSRDHTRAEFARRLGRPPPREAWQLVQSFIFGSRGIGDDAGIRIDPGTDTGTVPLEEGDRLLLCSDGLSNFVDDARIREVLAGRGGPEARARELADLALASGSDDNVTALVVQVGPGDA